MTLKKYLLLSTLFVLVFTAVEFPALSQAQQTQQIQVPQAPSQQRCGLRINMVKHLSDNYGESQLFLGIAQPGVAIELFVNKEKESWTILMSRIDGMSCGMAGGKGVRFFDGTNSDE